MATKSSCAAEGQTTKVRLYAAQRAARRTMCLSRTPYILISYVTWSFARSSVFYVKIGLKHSLSAALEPHKHLEFGSLGRTVARQAHRASRRCCAARGRTKRICQDSSLAALVTRPVGAQAISVGRDDVFYVKIAPENSGSAALWPHKFL